MPDFDFLCERIDAHLRDGLAVEHVERELAREGLPQGDDVRALIRARVDTPVGGVPVCGVEQRTPAALPFKQKKTAKPSKKARRK
jgi:hypothetical protein